MNATDKAIVEIAQAVKDLCSAAACTDSCFTQYQLTGIYKRMEELQQRIEALAA